MNYYNEIDPFCAEWLNNLIKAKQIPQGYVDTRSIELVQPDDLREFSQCHFFAGIGGWSYALKLAGWPEDRPIWTGSCPCQPFSVAGKGKGTDDARHLWPQFERLIAACKPPVVAGEQVASNAGRDWLTGVRTDLEALGYEVGAADLCAAGVGAPHIRQRLWWVGDANSAKRAARNVFPIGTEEEPGCITQPGLLSVGLAHTNQQLAHRGGDIGARGWSELADRSGLGNPNHEGSQGRGLNSGEHTNQRTAWTPSEFVQCTDGKTRRFESGSFPLVNGATQRVGRLRAYGNCIVAPLAAEVIKAYMDVAA